MRMGLAAAEFFHVGGHDEANGRFAEFFAKRVKTTNQPCVTTRSTEDLNYTLTEARNHASFCSRHINERNCDDFNKQWKFEADE